MKFKVTYVSIDEIYHILSFIVKYGDGREASFCMDSRDFSKERFIEKAEEEYYSELTKVCAKTYLNKEFEFPTKREELEVKVVKVGLKKHKGGEYEWR